jgi:mitosis inhibitor protein kinase SWE1
MEGAHFSSLQELRRSLSRSPSKPSRFQLRTGKTETPGSPLSPLALARAFSPKSSHQPQSPVNTFSDSLFGSQSTKKKFTIRRSGPFRSSPRNRNKSKSPRRVLVDSTDLGNSTPVSRSLFGEENNTPARKPVAESPETHDNMRLDFNDAPIKPLKFGLSRPNVPSNFFATNQASPLKRRDGISGFDSASVETPNPKRRSVHAETSFNIFETPMSRPATEDFDFNRPQESEPTNLFATPVTQSQTPFKRTGSVRRPSAPRTSTSSPRPKTVYDGEFVVPGIAASKNKPRTSIDGRVRADSSQMRHPLANAVTASPSTPIFNDNSTSYTPAPVKTIFHDNSTSYTPAPVKTIFHDNSTSFTPAPVRTVMRSNCLFGKSLPIGAARPLETGTDEVFATPAALKQVRQNAAPIPQSTGGLLSKKHRDIGLETLEYKAPDTPIKLHRQSYPPAAETPTSNRRSHSMKPLQQPVFGTASTPFSVTASTPFNATQTMNEGSNFFTRMSGMRRRSFVDIDGDDDCNHSPTGNKHMTGSQSSADDGPPTPTKSSNSNSHGRKSKDNSLRRKTFAYSRGSLSNVFPESGSPSINIPAPLDFGSSVSATPHTPSEPCMPPDPSFLSISGSRRESFSFNSSLDSNPFPPATPTGPRGSIGFFGQSQTISLTDNDVDESLAARFRAVQKLDGTEGEFSQVFKVSRPIKEGVVHSSPPGSRFWVVKKSKKPLLGAKDSEQKQREVQALKAVRGHEHIVLFEDSWVDHGHLYIQTEYCEEGNLRQFIDKYGRAGCLDNFRTWKILLELSSVRASLPLIMEIN